MASTAATTTTTPPAPADGSADDDAYFAQRQSTMDSATLDKLLRAEKHLFHAGQATLQAWKLIGRDPDNEQQGNGAAAPSRATDADLISASSATTASSSSASSNTMPISRGPASAPAGMYDHGSTGFLSSSPRLPFEIPRPEGRASIGQFSTRTTMSIVDSEINFFAENGRSKSSHANIFGFTRDSPPRSEVTQFNFTVRKSDSVLEKLGSKKASIQLQVDIEARMLNFLSPHDNRESYSCAAVTARPQSRLGMQLKIQTGTTSLTKKITFLSSDDRTNFMDALEQGKVMCKKSVNPFRATPENAVMTDECSVLSNDSTRSKIRESIMTDQFSLLPGEEVLEHVQRVTNLVVMSQSDRAVQGLFAFDYYAEKKKLPGGKPTQKENGWMLYSPVAEYQRLGFLRGFDSYTNRKPSDPDGITWRLLKNSKFRFSPTYPQLMVVPSLMTEEQLVQSARFRSLEFMGIANIHKMRESLEALKGTAVVQKSGPDNALKVATYVKQFKWHPIRVASSILSSS
ncbi:hypothetical protein P43SY_009575 [Pythium insidiosum]|uniref:Myotubularin phosphatase domain-containing protein n=1 Tax=Pythium insidiosum TaxID=114742 RepID=A0AAD5Q7Y8_PYTIN|nr:hypothetical protein P43SY_009575 [Pythium insidiosum]